MLEEPIYTNALLCERGLIEQDGVLSAIRIVDVFGVDPASKTPAEERPIPIQLLFMAKFAPDDESEHLAEVYLERPGEDSIKIGESEPAKAVGRFPDAPRGLTLSVRFGVIPRALGVHYINVVLDGRRVARIPFTLTLKSQMTSTVKTESEQR